MTLAGWNVDKKLRLTIDGSKVDGDLTDFPVLITLSSGTGQTSFDTTRVFDELGFPASDDFTAVSGSAPNSTRWAYTASPNNPYIQNNKLYGAVNAGVPIKYARGRFFLSGDFDIQVDFELETYPNTDKWDTHIRIDNGSESKYWYLFREYNGSQRYRFLTGTASWITVTAPTSDTTGKLRFTRVGSSIRAWYWGGSSWTELVSGSPLTSTADLRVRLFWQSVTPGFPNASSYFDNFTINTGTVIWESGHPYRRKMAITDVNDNQLYTEIGRWDDEDNENEEANLWVKIPTIASGTDTDLYLYYDNTHDDNVHYVNSIEDLSYQLAIPLGSEGTYDTARTGAPRVIKESDSSYKMWYSGHDGTYWRICYADSTDGITWSNHQLVIDIGAEGTYDVEHSYVAFVIRESASSYKMWYSGRDVPNVWRILYATSTNGTIWTNHQMVVDRNQEGTYDTNNVYYPSVIKESDSSYKIWYSGYDGASYRVMYAISETGTTWSGHQMVLDWGSEGTYDDGGRAYYPYVLKESDTLYKMWYSGRFAEDGVIRTIYAESSDGIVWENYRLDLNTDSEGTYDTNHAYAASVIEDNGAYKMWYTGYDGSNYRVLYSPNWSTNVWDGNFRAVYHMNQDPSGGTGAIKDSTPNVHHGTPQGSMTYDDLIDGKTGKALAFDGNDDWIEINSVASTVSGSFTWEVIYKVDPMDLNYNGMFLAVNVTPDGNRFIMSVDDDSGVADLSLSVDNPASNYETPGTFDDSTWRMYTITLNNSTNRISIFADSVNKTADTGALASTDIFSRVIPSDRVSIAQEFDTATPSNFWPGELDEIRMSSVVRSDAWIKATYYSSWDNFVTFGEAILFTFSNAIPVDSSTVYGTTQNLYLTVTVTGSLPNYDFDATFYDALDDGAIGSTVSGSASGQTLNELMTTSSGTDYSWYVTAVSSGIQDTSTTYTFTNKFLCEGHVEVGSTPASGIAVKLYRKSTGELIGSDTSTGVSGTFSIITDYNEYHYAVALSSWSDTNAVIEDWLIP